MISNSMQEMLKGSSVIRAMFEEGQKMEKIYGKENVFDFSLGNPNVKAPKKVNDTIKQIVDDIDSVELHGYMLNSGFVDVREAIAKSINKRFGTNFDFNNIVMTVGAAGGLNVLFKTILNKNDEVIVFAPYFGEYRNYIKNYDGVVVEIKQNPPTFMPNIDEFKKKITKNTKAVIINNPNNPTGVVYPESVVKDIAKVLNEKQKEFNKDIYLISDEPYRELVYENEEVPYLTKYYNNSIVGYSYSKSLSLPGERIGYLVVPNEVSDFENMVQALSIATRILGFVNAPSLQQKLIMQCLDEKVDIDYYKKNRDLLYSSLTKLGFECVEPKGAFYLFMKAPNGDDKEFSRLAKEEHILLVPGSSFSGEGYVRLAYCVSYETIQRSIPAFEKLAKKIGII